MNITLPGKAATLMASQRERAEKQRARLGVEARSWYRISNAASDDEAEVMIYDEVGGWFGCTADDMIAELRQITAPRMRVRINSPGGSVFEGIAIANALRAHPASVTVQVDAVAASIASVIAMAGDRIEMAPNSMLMIHDASGLCMGNAADMEEMAELLDLISDNIADAYAARAGGTREQWRERMRAETWYLPEDAVENGLADEAVQAPKAGNAPPAPEEDDEPDMARAWDLAAYGYQGPRRDEPKTEEQQPLTINIGAAVGEDFVEQLRALVRQEVKDRTVAPASDATPTGPVAETEPVEPAPEPAAVPEPEVPAAEPVDAWAADIAGLLTTPADDWAADLTHLIGPDTSSRAAAEA
ncbi:ATP-dependent Clp protease proteolytic subunit [Streptomyces sp. TRM72054]|uniref:head maturation protease, ClpP-related n=1 Tax=Streptomyces sp. TRM72054 TaxID=2870562 RepID=UPI001C8CD501|nr:head maturation protease, ClpP-related [Streptomyces sp. TRM72054]MBX9392272.1 ATP-dependent Clp protease proteolytic subunit [Streptomyces sp. TRM72054]